MTLPLPFGGGFCFALGAGKRRRHHLMRLRLSGLIASVALIAPPTPAHATTYSFQTISDPSAVNNGGVAPSTWVWGINNNDQIVGSYTNGTDQSGFLYSGVNYTTVTVPGNNYRTIASGINNNGQVVGTYYYGNGRSPTPTAGSSGSLYSGGTFTTMPGIIYVGSCSPDSKCDCWAQQC
jgi:hypothetical protein